MSCLPAAFEQRERVLLGPRFEALFAAPGPAPARGLTVNTLRCTPGQVARGAGLPLEPSPFCARAFRLTDPDLRPGRHPWHHAGAFYVQEPSAAAPAPSSRARRVTRGPARPARRFCPVGCFCLIASPSLRSVSAKSKLPDRSPKSAKCGALARRSSCAQPVSAARAGARKPSDTLQALPV